MIWKLNREAGRQGAYGNLMAAAGMLVAAQELTGNWYNDCLAVVPEAVPTALHLRLLQRDVVEIDQIGAGRRAQFIATESTTTQVPVVWLAETIHDSELWTPPKAITVARARVLAGVALAASELLHTGATGLPVQLRQQL